MPILIKETIEQFGYDPLILKPMSGKKVIIACTCGKHREVAMYDYSRSPDRLCKSCSQAASHKNPASGYNSESYRELRSKIAQKSNINRKITSSKFIKYLPFLEQVKDGKITFIEIANELGVDDSTVCKFFHNNFQLKSKAYGSVQEKEVLTLLQELYPDKEIVQHKRYDNKSRCKSDFFIDGVGHIEYDGNGFYHQLKSSDIVVNGQYTPIRLNAQVIFGGIDYLRFKLLNEKSGYCSVTSLNEYRVEFIKNRKISTKMLENCHVLGNCAGTDVIGLFHADKLIGVAKFGNPTNKKDIDLLELRRFFVLDGTPRNAESWFLRKCELLINRDLVTYVHHDEKGSYLKALGWIQMSHPKKDYDFYLINGQLINKRRMFGWTKKIGLVEKLGTTSAKEALCHLMGGKKIMQPSKIKFIKRLKNG